MKGKMFWFGSFILLLANLANAATASFTFAPQYQGDNSVIRICGDGETASDCLKEYRFYMSQVSKNEVSPSPTVAAIPVPAARGAWCIEGINRDLPFYLAVQFVFGDNSVSALSLPNYVLPGNIVDRSAELIDVASVDGDDMMFLRRNFGAVVPTSTLTVGQCPQYSGTDDFVKAQPASTDLKAADLNNDGVVDGDDLMLLRNRYFGGATQ